MADYIFSAILCKPVSLSGDVLASQLVQRSCNKKQVRENSPRFCQGEETVGYVNHAHVGQP